MHVVVVNTSGVHRALFRCVAKAPIAVASDLFVWMHLHCVPTSSHPLACHLSVTGYRALVAAIAAVTERTHTHTDRRASSPAIQFRSDCYRSVVLYRFYLCTYITLMHVPINRTPLLLSGYIFCCNYLVLVYSNV